MDILFLIGHLISEIWRISWPLLTIVVCVLFLYLAWRLATLTPEIVRASELCKKFNRGEELSESEKAEIDNLIERRVLEYRGLAYRMGSVGPAKLTPILRLTNQTVDSAFGR